MHGLTTPKSIPLSFSVEVLNSISTFRQLQIITIFCLQMQYRIPKERNSQLHCHENFRSRQIYSNFNQKFFLRNSLFSLRGNQKFRRTQCEEHCCVGTAWWLTLLRNELRQLSPVFQIFHSVREDTPEYKTRNFRRTQCEEHCSVGTAWWLTLLLNEPRQLSPVFQIFHSVGEDTPEYNTGDPINP